MSRSALSPVDLDTPEAGDPVLVQRFQDELSLQLEELRDQQAATEQALAWFASLFEALPLPVLLLTEMGAIVEANGAAADYLGLQRPLPRRPLMLRRLLGGHEADLRWVNALSASKAQGSAELSEQRLVAIDGSERTARITLRHVAQAEAQQRGVAHICTLIDLTEHVKARALEAARIAAEQRQQAAESMARTRSHTLSRVSHELRTPLNAIIGFSQLLRSDAERLPEAHRPYLDHIVAAGKDLLCLVDEVLDINRAESGQLKLDMVAVSLIDEAWAAIHLNEPSASALNQHLCFTSAEVPQVRADARRVREVLLNLISNAIKYGRHGGHVWIEAGHDQHNAWIDVRDDGIGMEAEQLSHLFEPFNRLGVDKGQRPGHGLGLSICKTYCDLMGGQLQVESVAGQGSRFRLSLPRWDR